jgi:branched-chain amino acid transport system permease protein
VSSAALFQAIASGIVTGCVYALVALSLVIIYKSTDVVNFAGGELVMIGGYVGLLAADGLGLGYLVIFPLVSASVFAVGALFDRITLHRISGRTYSRQAALVPMTVATIGLSYLLKGAVRVVPYTEEPRRLAPLWRGEPVFIGDVVLQWQDLAIIAVTTAIMLGLWVFFRYTMLGKALRATSQNARAAALLGMPVKTMRMAVWGLSAAIAGIAGVLLAPKLLMTPDSGSVVMLAFAAAIVGGFSSLPGCIVGGIVLGVLQNLVGILISPQAIAVTPFFVIMMVLLLRPQGLFGETIALKKV